MRKLNNFIKQLSPILVGMYGRSFANDIEAANLTIRSLVKKLKIVDKKITGMNYGISMASGSPVVTTFSIEVKGRTTEYDFDGNVVDNMDIFERAATQNGTMTIIEV